MQKLLTIVKEWLRYYSLLIINRIIEIQPQSRYSTPQEHSTIFPLWKWFELAGFYWIANTYHDVNWRI